MGGGAGTPGLLEQEQRNQVGGRVGDGDAHAIAEAEVADGHKGEHRNGNHLGEQQKQS